MILKKNSYRAALLTATVLISGMAVGATVTSTFDFELNNVGLDGGRAGGFDMFTTTDVGIATLRFGAEAPGGDVDATASARLASTFSNSVALSEASAVSVSMGLDSLRFCYNAFTGADAGAFVNFDPFLGFNPPEFRVVGDDYRLDTSGSRSSFGSTGTDRATRELVGVGPDVSLGLAVRAEVTLDASQTTSLEVSDLTGVLVAVHSSGVFRLADFGLVSDAFNLLDLSVLGDWTLSLSGVRLRNMFDSATGISAGYELGLAGEVPGLSGSCGNFARDSDNEFGCIGDIGASGDTAQLNLLNPAPFELDWGSRSAVLGTISVLADPVGAPSAVPLPAGAYLLIRGLGLLGGLRRKKRMLAHPA